MDRKVTCFNRDQHGHCLAYNKAECSWECQARIPNAKKKIELLTALLEKAQASKLRRDLEHELLLARQVAYAEAQGSFEDWMSCYYQDLHRGSKGGGASEGDANRATAMKQLMKDNRGVKPTRQQTAEYKEALKVFEAEQGRLERAGRSGLSGSLVDSYTGRPICMQENETGYCPGEKLKSGRLKKACASCFYYSEILNREN